MAKRAGVLPSTLSRLGNGKRPDIDSFAKLIQWLGIPAERFLKVPAKTKKKEPDPVAVVSSYLRASKSLSPKSADFLEDVFRAAFEKLKALEDE